MGRVRNIADNSIQHITNRGNDKKVIFPQPIDYGSFLVLLREARERFDVQLFSYCLIVTHFHLVVRAANLEAISAYMHYIEREHACDLRSCYRSKGHGHIFQRRYWNDPIESDAHLLRVMRYVEANPVRAGLVARPHDWEWGSFWDRVTGERDIIHPAPFGLPPDWETIVSFPMDKLDLETIRHPKKIGRPKATDGTRKSEAGSLIIET
jgi:putative transposase